jgi:hypothetical protein
MIKTPVLPRPTPKVKKAPRDLEGEFTRALESQGWLVVTPDIYFAMQCERDGAIVMQYQPKVPNVRGGRRAAYKLDFCDPAFRVYCEIDGYNRFNPVTGKIGGKGGHITWKGFHSDRRRDRALSFAGWRGLRYGPGDFATPAETLACAREFIAFILQVRNQ